MFYNYLITISNQSKEKQALLITEERIKLYLLPDILLPCSSERPILAFKPLLKYGLLLMSHFTSLFRGIGPRKGKKTKRKKKAIYNLYACLYAYSMLSF